MFHYIFIVDNCPSCGSVRTGKYISYHGKDGNSIIAYHMKRGELVRTTIFDDNDERLFCDDCGLSWYGKPTWIWINGQDLKKLKEKYGFDKNTIRDTENIRANSRAEFKKVRSERRRAKIRKFFGLSGKNSLPIKNPEAYDTFEDVTDDDVVDDKNIKYNEDENFDNNEDEVFDEQNSKPGAARKLMKRLFFDTTIGVIKEALPHDSQEYY